MQEITTCICISPINVAIVKYWGKKDEILNIPLNPSISLTLDTSQIFSKTKVDLLCNRKKNSSIFIFDGKIQKILPGSRIFNVIDAAKSFGLKHPIRIESSNSFPTSVGLASSASAFSSIAMCIGKLAGFSLDQVKILARLGSGSACRSLYGGFVEWVPGDITDGSDSLSYQLFDQFHWQDLRVIIIQVSKEPKFISSSQGMKKSVEGSELLKIKTHEKISSKRASILKSIIRERDFPGFCEILMKESHTLHAICDDTYPPISPTYLSQTSHKIMNFVHSLNTFIQRTVCGYTFDAGPNAFIFIQKNDIKLFFSFFMTLFSCVYNQSESILTLVENYQVKLPCKGALELNFQKDDSCSFEQIFVASTGNGPCFLEQQ